MDILTKIQILLDEQGKSQTDLTNALGLKQPAFSEWKKGKSASYKKYLYQIASFLGVSPDYLLGKTDDRQMFIIQADPDKVREHEELQEKRRKESQRQLYEAMKDYYEGPSQTKKAPASAGDKNIIRIAGRDGSYVVKRLTDEELAAYKTMIAHLPDADDL